MRVFVEQLTADARVLCRDAERLVTRPAHLGLYHLSFSLPLTEAIQAYAVRF